MMKRSIVAIVLAGLCWSADLACGADEADPSRSLRNLPPTDKPRFEVKYERPHHDHLICVECGAIQEVQWPQIEKIQEKKCKELGFIPVFHRHEIFGRCPKCVREAR